MGGMIFMVKFVQVVIPDVREKTFINFDANLSPYMVSRIDALIKKCKNARKELVKNV